MASHLAEDEVLGDCYLKERQAAVFPVPVFRLCLAYLWSLVHAPADLCYSVMPGREKK